MKSVAGTLRLDLASYRELEAFAQFGSDLDKATQAKLNRGARTVEVLKQDLHKPLRVEQQVLILYCLTRGFLDDIPLADIRRFEAEIIEWTGRNHKELYDHIRSTGKLPEEQDMNAAITEFKKQFVVSE